MQYQQEKTRIIIIIVDFNLYTVYYFDKAKVNHVIRPIKILKRVIFEPRAPVRSCQRNIRNCNTHVHILSFPSSSSSLTLPDRWILFANGVRYPQETARSDG